MNCFVTGASGFIGANLAHDRFVADRDAVLARAASAGVAQMVIPGSSE